MYFIDDFEYFGRIGGLTEVLGWVCKGPKVCCFELSWRLYILKPTLLFSKLKKKKKLANFFNQYEFVDTACSARKMSKHNGGLLPRGVDVMVNPNLKQPTKQSKDSHIHIYMIALIRA